MRSGSTQRHHTNAAAEDDETFVDIIVSGRDEEAGHQPTITGHSPPSKLLNPSIALSTNIATTSPQQQQKPGLMMHLVIMSVYVAIWTAESMVIHGAGHLNYVQGSVTLSIEIFKMVMAATLFFGNGGTIEQVKGYSSRGKMCFGVGLIYCLYNLARYYGLTIIMPGTFRVLINMRIVITGVLYQALDIGERLNQRKWIALFMLMTGCAISKWGEFAAAWWDLVVILFLAFLGSLGGVYNEKFLKRDPDTDINLQNIYLYCFTISFTIITLLITEPDTSPSVMFRNWEASTMIPMIVLGGGGGFTTALMLKKLNVLTKEYANGFEMLSTALVSAYLFGEVLGIRLFISILVVATSIIVFYWEHANF